MLENRKKLYSLLLESKEIIFLSMQYASSLEEAATLAKLEYMRIHHLSEDSLAGAKIGLYTIKTINEIVKESKNLNNIKQGMVSIARREGNAIFSPLAPVEEVKEEPVDKSAETIKNELMAKIIGEKNIQLYKDNKEVFTKSERLYLEDKLEI